MSKVPKPVNEQKMEEGFNCKIETSSSEVGLCLASLDFVLCSQRMR